jgi:hypothetical protein
MQKHLWFKHKLTVESIKKILSVWVDLKTWPKLPLVIMYAGWLNEHEHGLTC